MDNTITLACEGGDWIALVYYVPLVVGSLLNILLKNKREESEFYVGWIILFLPILNIAVMLDLLTCLFAKYKIKFK